MRKIIVAFLLKAPLKALAFEEVHRCDEVAAHPDDPGRWASGIADGDLVPAPAMSFCTAAVQAYPDVARFQFQLARAYWAAGRHGDAMPILFALADQDYAGAMVYLRWRMRRDWAVCSLIPIWPVDSAVWQRSAGSLWLRDHPM